MKTSKKTQSYNLKIIILVTIIGLTIYTLLPRLNSFKTSLHSIQQADPLLLLAAVIVFGLTYFAATATFCLLCFFKLSYRTTLLIQVADGFTNKLAPAGLGAVTTNYLYIKKKAKSNLKAGYIAVLNNLVGFAAHIFLLIVLIIYNQLIGHESINLDRPHISRTVIVIISLLVIIGLLIRLRTNKNGNRKLSNLTTAIKISFQKPGRMAAALGTSLILTMLYALTLFIVVLALNLDVNFLQSFLVFTVSIVALTVFPTPGGIGGVEASLVAAFMACGVAAGPALSATLAYRFITYWLPLIPGAIALEIAYKNCQITRP